MHLDWRPRAGVRPPASLTTAVLIFCGAWLGALLICLYAQGTCSSILGVIGLLALSILPGNQVVRLLLNREQLRIDSRCIEYLRIDGFAQERRRIPLRAIRRLSPYRVTVYRRDRRDWKRYHYEFGLAIESLGRPLWVGQCRKPAAAYRLHEDVERDLRERFPAWADVPECPDREILVASDALLRPPSDSTLTCRHEWDRTEFTRSTPMDGSDGLLYLIISLITSAMACAILGCILPWLNWPLILILSGFVGLLELIGWWGWASQCRRWVVRPGEVRTSFPGLGLLWSRTTEIEWLDRIELRRIPPIARGHFSRSPGFDLVLVAPEGGSRATFFGPLTEGEARWMAGILAEVFKDALPRRDQEVYRWSVTVDEPTAGSRAMADSWLDEGLPEKGPTGTTPDKIAEQPTTSGGSQNFVKSWNRRR